MIHGLSLLTESFLQTLPFVVLQPAPSPSGIGPDELTDYWPTIVRAGWFLAGFLFIVIFSWIFIEPTFHRILRRRNNNNPTVRQALHQYFRVFFLLTAVFVGAGVAGYGQFLSRSAIVIGAATLAIGIAAREVIGSVVSGIALVFDPEFNIGDNIKWEDGEGVVESITLRVTRVKTPNGGLVTIPNTILTNQAITRPFGRGNYRIVEHFQFAYDDDIGEAMTHLKDVATELDRILSDPPPSVYVENLGDEAVIVRVQYWIEDPGHRNILDIRSAYSRAVKNRIENADITISPPTQRDLQGRIEISKITD